MAEPAYDIDYFSPAKKREEKKPRERTSNKRVKREKSERAVHAIKMVRFVAAVVLMVGLMCGVLYTQTTITELQSQINDKESALTDATATNVYLNHQLDGMVNTRYVEERAKELGLVKMSQAQVTYVRVEDGQNIELRESGISQWYASLKNSFAAKNDGEIDEKEEEAGADGTGEKPAKNAAEDIAQDTLPEEE